MFFIAVCFLTSMSGPQKKQSTTDESSSDYDSSGEPESESIEGCSARSNEEDDSSCETTDGSQSPLVLQASAPGVEYHSTRRNIAFFESSQMVRNYKADLLKTRRQLAVTNSRAEMLRLSIREAHRLLKSLHDELKLSASGQLRPDLLELIDLIKIELESCGGSTDVKITRE